VHINSQRLISLILVIATLGLLFILPAGSQSVSHRVAFAESSVTRGLPLGRMKGGVEAMANTPAFKRQPVRFEVNRGQTNPQARFIARTADSILFLAQSEAVLCLPELPAQLEPIRTAAKPRKATTAELLRPVQNAVLRLRPVKSNPQPQLVGIDKLPGVSNYFVGNDPKKWRTNVESYAKVKYENLYPGIDLLYYGNEAGELEYDFIVAAGANPDLIAMSVEGAGEVDVDQQSGDLLLSTSVGRVRQHAPQLYQEVNGKRQEIAGHYRVLQPVQPIQNPKSQIQNPLLAFEVGDYDASKPLVIDPVVVYSTLLGGAAGNFDGAKGVAVDAQGNAYITGNTESSDFPTRNPLDGTPPQRFGASSKAFISKFAPDGSLIYSTFLGGNDSSSGGSAIAVDSTGNVYVAGSAGSGLPIVNAFQSSLGSTADAFITKFNADGNAIIFSSYLGGNEGESVRDLKLDAQNNVYLLGEIPGRGVTNVTFPTVNPTQANYGGGDSDMFLSVVAATGANLLFSTFLGGNGAEEAKSMSVSSDGNRIAITGASDSANLITGGIGAQATDPSCDELEALVLILSKSISQGLYGLVVVPIFVQVKEGKLTCLEGLKLIEEVVLKSTAIASGTKTQQQSLAATDGGGFDVYVIEGDATANNARAKSSFGGSRDEFVAAGTKDSRGAVYIAGDTTSIDLPTIGPTQAAPGGANDNGFVVVFAPDTYDVLFATYLGGDGFTLPESIAVDAQGNIFVSGVVTTGTNFPATPGAFQRELKGRNDAFLVKYSPVDVPTGPDFTLSFPESAVTATYGKKKISADINRTGGFTGNVTIEPVSLTAGVVMKGGPVSTTEGSTSFKLKIKPAAAPGTHQLTFSATDSAGRSRTASFTLVIQPE